MKSHHRVRHIGRLELRYLLLGQLDLECSDSIFKMGRPRRADDRRTHGRFGEDPCQGDLRSWYSAAFRKRGNCLDYPATASAVFS